MAAVDGQGRVGPASRAQQRGHGRSGRPPRPAGSGRLGATGPPPSTWTTGALNGGELVGYRVAATGVTARTVTGTTATVTGLVAGRSYPFTVRALTREQGGAGPTVTGAPSTAVSMTAATVPRVDVVSAQQPGGQLTVVAQVADGAAAMVSCRVLIGTASHPGLPCQAGRTTFQITATVGTTVTVTAVGTNAIGTGQPGQGQQLTPPPAASRAGRHLRLQQGSPSGDTVEVAECETADESALRMWSRVAGSERPLQRWTVTSLGGGTYRIVKADSSQSLDACSSSTPWLFGYSGQLLPAVADHVGRRWRLHAQRGEFRAGAAARGLLDQQRCRRPRGRAHRRGWPRPGTSRTPE